MSDAQFGRKASLVVVEGTKGLDLSNLRFRFKTTQQDVESPNTATIRVYNLKPETVKSIRGEYSRVVLQAGYEGNYGVIFEGTIRQFRIGRENGTDTYLDILAADGDIPYNWSVCNKTLAKGWTQEQAIKEAADAMVKLGAQTGFTDVNGLMGGTVPNPRGKVMWGLAKAHLRASMATTHASWNIANGQINVVALDGYLPGAAVVLTSETGLIGRPEQTNEGIRVRCLLNPRIVVGKLVKIDNKSVNQTVNQNPNAAPGPAFDRYQGVQLLASVTADGIYRVYVAEHDGDTRGQAWYSDLMVLAVNADTKKVVCK